VAAAARVRVWKRATSLGGVESLIEHRASVEGPDTTCPRDLLRLSVGIESPDDLAGDLEAALDGVAPSGSAAAEGRRAPHDSRENTAPRATAPAGPVDARVDS
jgi:hypothetical protein